MKKNGVEDDLTAIYMRGVEDGKDIIRKEYDTFRDDVLRLIYFIESEYQQCPMSTELIDKVRANLDGEKK